MKSFLALSFVLATITSDLGAEKGEAYGLGTRTCAQFAQEYGNSKNPEMIESFYFTWAQGFMSGLNLIFVANNHAFYDLGNSSMADQKSRLRAYCSQHPLSAFFDAVMGLYKTFPVRSENSN
jgi:hypothetical protein